MKSTTALKNELTELKNHVIGIIKIQGRFELVIDYQETNQTVDTIRLTEFAAIQPSYNIPVSFGVLNLFPDNKNMNEMLEDIYLWDSFSKLL